MAVTGGDLYSQLRLMCNDCGWAPPDDQTVGVLAVHWETGHSGRSVTYVTRPVCVCGAAMQIVRISAAGGGEKHHFECPSCAETGYVYHGVTR